MRSLSLLALVAAASCTVDATQLVVVIQTDLHSPDEIQGFRVTVHPADDPEDTQTRSFTLGGDVVLPGSFGVAPKRGDADRRVRVEAAAILDESEIVTTSAISSFVEHERLRLDLFLAARCRGVECDPGGTCGRDGCQPELRDAGELSEYVPGEPIDPEPNGGWHVVLPFVGAPPSPHAAFDDDGNTYVTCSFADTVDLIYYSRESSRGAGIPRRA